MRIIYKKKVSLRNEIITSFIATITLIIGVIGYVAFSSWKASTNSIIMKIENDSNNKVLSEIENFLKLPMYIDESGNNLLKNGIINMEDKRELEAYFSGIMQANPENVYSFSLGTEKGEYYGARRNVNNEIEIMISDESTDGNSKYYSVTDDLTAGEFIEDYGKFDPRKREWYRLAKEQGKPVFSSIYEHFVVKDLAITAAYPVYDKEGVFKGVLGTHFPLSKLNTYLKDITKEKMATAYIIEKDSGMIVANSLDNSNFIVSSGGGFDRISIKDIDNPYILSAYENYKTNTETHYMAKTKEDRLHISLTDYQRYGLDWVLITVIPESQFTNIIGKSISICIIVSIFMIVIGVALWIKKTKRILKPINNLINTTESFSKGDFLKRAEIAREDEIGKLSRTFNAMADELCSVIYNLKNKKLQLEAVNSELENTNTALIHAKEAADEANAAKSLFIANISHELRTPLNIIFGAIQLFKTLFVEGENLSQHSSYSKYIGMMQQNCFRLLRLINNLIEITKSDAKFLDIHLKNSNIITIVEEITLSIVQYVKSKDMTLVFDTEVEERIIAIDLDKMERIMLNLLSNAIKYTKEKGTITVNIYDNAEWVTISVKDTGIGIPNEMLNKIFDRFIRVDDSLNRQVEGSGIGLSLVKALVEAHSGNISVKSTVGVGTEFIIQLPVRLIDEVDTSIEEYVCYQTKIERIQIEFSDIYF